MKRTVYEAPVTELFRVELEGAFMSASVVNEENQSGVSTSGHELNELNADDFGWNNFSKEDNQWK